MKNSATYFMLILESLNTKVMDLRSAQKILMALVLLSTTAPVESMVQAVRAEGVSNAAQQFYKALSNPKILFTSESMNGFLSELKENVGQAAEVLQQFTNKINNGPISLMNGVNNNNFYNLTLSQTMALLTQLAQGPFDWHTVNEVGAYYTNGFIYHQGFFLGWGGSAQVICPDNGGGLHERSYKNANDWWPFDWENSGAISNCDGLIINSNNGCNLSSQWGPFQAHWYTSYIYNYNNPTVGVRKSDYLRNPQNYPAITALLLVMSSADAPYIEKIRGNNTGYTTGFNGSDGSFGGNLTCHHPETSVLSTLESCIGCSGGDEGKMDKNVCNFYTWSGELACKYATINYNCGASSVMPSLWMQCPTALDIIITPQDGHGSFGCNNITAADLEAFS